MTGREHPLWCEPRLCAVQPDGASCFSGHHLDDFRSLTVEADDIRVDLQTAAFQDSDDTIDGAPHVLMTVVNTAFINAYQEAHLSQQDARALAAALLTAADKAETLGTWCAVAELVRADRGC